MKPIRGEQLTKEHPLTRGLVGCWLFNEGAGNKVFDLSGNGNTGTLEAGTNWIVGESGYALNFVGGNNSDYVSTNSGAAAGDVLDQTSNFTILAKFRAVDVSVNYDAIVGKRAEGADYQYELRQNASKLNVLTTGGSVSADTTLVNNTWYTGGFTHDGANVRLYLNGLLDSTPSAKTITHKNVDVSIGMAGETYDLHYWDGDIEWVMIYNRALSASEIALLYREPFCMFERDPIELWSAATLGAIPTGMAGAMTTNTRYWGW